MTSLPRLSESFDVTITSEFADAGEHELKGVPDRWRLYRAVG